MDDAQLQQFVNSKTQRPIDFTYSTILVDEVKIGVIRIPIQPRPYYLEKDYGKLKRHVIYIRRGSSTDQAAPEELLDMGRAEVKEVQEITDLVFEFANSEKRERLGSDINIETILLNVPTNKEIPDYREESSSGTFGFRTPSLNYANSNYYRDIVNYHYILTKTKKLSFSLKNNSRLSVLDVKVEIIIEKQGDGFSFFFDEDFPDFPQSKVNHLLNARSLSEQISKHNKPSIKIQDFDDKYRIEVPFEKVQPQQTVFCSENIYLNASESFNVSAKVTIYADNISVPIASGLNINCNVKNASGSLKEIKTMHIKLLKSKRSNMF